MSADLLAGVLTGRRATPDSAEAWLVLLSQARRANLAARLAQRVAEVPLFDAGQLLQGHGRARGSGTSNVSLT